MKRHLGPFARPRVDTATSTYVRFCVLFTTRPLTVNYNDFAATISRSVSYPPIISGEDLFSGSRLAFSQALLHSYHQQN